MTFNIHHIYFLFSYIPIHLASRSTCPHYKYVYKKWYNCVYVSIDTKIITKRKLSWYIGLYVWTIIFLFLSSCWTYFCFGGWSQPSLLSAIQDDDDDNAKFNVLYYCCNVLLSNCILFFLLSFHFIFLLPICAHIETESMLD